MTQGALAVALVLATQVGFGTAAPSSAQNSGTEATGDSTETWNFSVTLDGQPIGEHRFSVRSLGTSRTVASRARFEIRMFGFTAYRYRHDADETWRDGCLASLDSSTDDDGKPGRVHRTFDAGCSFSFAYWNAAMLKQTQLINAQTGRAEPVRITRIGDGTVSVRGVDKAAQRWRIEGTERPIELWYSAQGEWLGLDSNVAGGRRISYRLEAAPSVSRKDSGKDNQ